ncbi:MAG TPA: hypothetical protein PLI05_03055 [Methanotrichaceae archaeon]|nr:hypothetical protein [Methanotrichaceae archaeon]HQF16029.1 hypothetical protein [Methanotrichaceae archaeon]HQI90855.1 hypothetical protein [Methanotrichaceae archaeon]HQJ28189.1 hypothetical protein [Methanotrichaceae archaeon]
MMKTHTIQDEWMDLTHELEACFSGIETKSAARELQARVEEALRMDPPPAVASRLDLLLLDVVEKGRESSCTNTRCPHYGKKCKMR